ncbi:MAG: ligase-associated DNA damage response endonuclease PdeM [Bacteroidota bacterium]
MIFNFKDQHLHLHHHSAIFWEEKQTLLLADLHLGKVKHFRKSGLAVPADASNENWDKLIALLLDFQPRKVYFLGDLFHSTYNEVWEELQDLMQQFSSIRFVLVKGNHDILHQQRYEETAMEVVDELFEMPFWLTHHPQEAVKDGFYNLAGHIHPSVHLKGVGRQSLRLPCFYFGTQRAILPAFGAFTGMAKVQAHEGDRVFVIVEDKVVEVSYA